MIEYISVFILLGVGADNFFVWNDLWKQSKIAVGLSPVKRMRLCFPTAVGSISNTNLTTFFAFMATGMSRMIPIATFGIFAGILILVN